MRHLTKAQGVILVVIAGSKGEGFEVQLTKELIDSGLVANVVRAIRAVADEIEKHGLR